MVYAKAQTYEMLEHIYGMCVIVQDMTLWLRDRMGREEIE